MSSVAEQVDIVGDPLGLEERRLLGKGQDRHGQRDGLRRRRHLTDTGLGMTEEIRARVFDPFFTTNGVGKGIGLGLSMAYGIIGQHGGTMAVESQEGQGSTFTVYLPRIDAPEVASPPGPSSPEGTELQ